MKDYLPTPKMAAVLWTVLVVVAVVLVGDLLDIVDLRGPAAAALTGVLAFAGGWAKSEDNGAEPTRHIPPMPEDE